MNDFTASNGRTVEVGEDRYVIRDQSNLNALASFDYLDGDDMHALSEYFQAKADERLGRWRWPENPDYVVYPEGEMVCITNERTGHGSVFGRQWYEDHKTGLLSKEEPGVYAAAGAYFDAHPAPKPWHDAEPGEVWELTVEGVTRTYASIASTGQNDVYVRFFPTHAVNAVTVGTKAPVISAGRRVFPEVAS